MSLISVSPLTEVNTYFNLVEDSGDEFLFNFLSPFNSLSIFFSSACVKSLKVSSAFECGNSNSKSFFLILS